MSSGGTVIRPKAFTWIILLAILIAGSLCLATPAFADDEYRTTIDEFTYGPYEIPAYDGDPSEQVNENLPTFSEEELTGEPYVVYGELDELGRCTPVESLLHKSLMPTWESGPTRGLRITGS